MIRYIGPVAGSLLSALVLATTGCVKRELEVRPDEGSVEISLKWASDPCPEAARYLFYNESGTLVKEVSGVTESFKGIFPTGTYRLVVHNTDAGQVDWRGTEKYESAEVFAKETNYSEGHHPSEGLPCVLEPRTVFGTGGCNESEVIKVRQLDTLRLTVTPVALTKRVKMRFVVNTDQAARSLTGVLSGVAPGLFLATQSCNRSSSCAMEFEAVPETSGAPAAGLTYNASMNVFDLLTTPESPAETNTISVVLAFEDGTQAMGTFDLTATLKQLIAANGGVLPAEIPVEVTLHMQSTGLNATVKPWDDSGTGSGDPRPQA